MTDEVRTRACYVSKRNSLNMAANVEVNYVPRDLEVADHSQDIRDRLGASQVFQLLSPNVLDWLATGTTAEEYSEGERIVRQGEPDRGVYIILQGHATLLVQDGDGVEHDITELYPEDIFGAMVLLRDELSPVSVIAREDLHVLIINGEMVNQLVEQNPRFAMELHSLVTERRRAISAIAKTEIVSTKQAASDNWIQLIRG